MARVKRAVHGKKRRRTVLERAQGFYGNKSRSYRAANEQVMHSMQYAARLNGTTYSRFIAGLHRAEVDVDRKMLADLAVRDPQAFSALVVIALGALDAEAERAADAGDVDGITDIDGRGTGDDVAENGVDEAAS
jgi:large subunit ribosomal protein L20